MTLKLSLVFAGMLGIVLAVMGCSILSGSRTPAANPAPRTTNGTPVVAVTPGEDDQIQAAARAMAEAMALVNYQDLAPWKNRLLELSNEDGKKFWQLNFDPMLKDVVAHRRIAEKVTIERVTIVTKETQTNAQGHRIAAAAVLVIGRIAFADDAGHHDDPINQPMLLGNLTGRWEFIAFVSPELLTPTTK